jgi:hypothetical protein
MSEESRFPEQPETRSQRRKYDHGTGPEERYVYTILGHLRGLTRREELRSQHGN